MINLEQLKQRYEQGKFGDINNQAMIDTKELCESNKKLINHGHKNFDIFFNIYK